MWLCICQRFVFISKMKQNQNQENNYVRLVKLSVSRALYSPGCYSDSFISLRKLGLTPLYEGKGLFFNHVTVYFVSKDNGRIKLFLSHDIMPNGLPCYEFYNALLLILQFMHIYWFYFILKLLFKIITGDGELKDNREYADKDK